MSEILTSPSRHAVAPKMHRSAAKVSPDSLAQVRRLHQLLDEAKAYNVSNHTVVLASKDEKKGSTQKLKHDRYHQLGNLLVGSLRHDGLRRIQLVPEATVEHLRRAIQNPLVENIVLIGPGTYDSWKATDGIVNTEDVSHMLGSHLKQGVFAHIGEGAIQTVGENPLGTFVLASNSVYVHNIEDIIGR